MSDPIGDAKKAFIIKTVEDVMLHGERMNVLRYLQLTVPTKLKPQAVGTAVCLDTIDVATLDGLYAICKQHDEKVRASFC